MWAFCPTTLGKPTSCWWHSCGFSLHSKKLVESSITFIYAPAIGPTSLPKLSLGKIEAGPPRWFSAYLDKLWEYSGYVELINPTLPTTGKEGTEWHEVAIVHQEGTNATQNYLVRAEGWKPIGPAHKLQMNHTHVELKADVEVSDIEFELMWMMSDSTLIQLKIRRRSW